MEHTLTRSTLEHLHPVLFAQLKAEFMAAGAQLERDRVVGVRAQSMPGCEALIEKLAADGKTTPGEAAIAVNAAQREAWKGARLALDQDAPLPSAMSQIGR